jgi:neutral ceramidase
MTRGKIYTTAIGLLLAIAVSGCGGGSDSSRTTEPPANTSAQFADDQLAQCVSSSSLLKVGEGLDAPSLRLEVPMPPVGKATGACADNNQFRFGSGLYDITGPVVNTSGMGWEYPLQVYSGLHTRLYARAYAIESPCNGKRILFLSADIGLMWPALRKGVLAAIAADEELSKSYQAENVMLSVTHTHQGPAGYSHDDGGNLFHWGYDDLNYRIIVAGMVEAIRLAHANIEAHPTADAITLAVDELLNANINRSRQAFVLNSEDERNEFLNVRGEPVDVNKRFVQMNLVRRNGSAVGVINWFGVHSTILGPELNLVGSDHKGYASLGFEKIMHSRYDAPAGTDNFVAAFAQADEGDSSPNIRGVEKPWPDPERGGGKDPYESNAIAGTKHLAKSLALFGQGRALSGPVDYRFFNVPIDSITVTDPVVLASLRHPAELDAEEKRTCSGSLGVSFGAGVETDGAGPSQEGVSCKSSPDVIAAAAADFDVLLNEPIPPFNAWHADIPSNLASTAVFCNRSRFQQPDGDYSCQAEKPVFLPLGPPVLPFQIFRIGNFAILALPWEVTTMSARRLRKDMLDVLAPAGVDTVIIAGLVNDYVNYLTTREEYSSQQYEGASTLYGPWTLAAVQQESRKLAQSLRDGNVAPEGPATPAGATPGLRRPPYLIADLPGPGGSYGALITDVPAAASPGDTVRAEFQAGYPRNDLRIQSSYVYAERKLADGSWQSVAQDRDPELLFIWKPMIPSPIPIDPAVVGPSTAEAVWTIPRNTPAGTYRLRHVGASTPSPQQAATPYEGISGEFTIAGSPALCP